MYVDPALIEYAVRLVGATRDPAAVGLARPRPVRHLRRQPARVDQPDPRRPRRWPSCAAATTRCPQDVRDLALDVLRHRLVLSYEALADDVSADDVLDPAAGRASALPERAARATADRRLDASRRQRTPATPERLLRRLEWRVHPPARRAAAGRLPHAVPRHRHRPRRPARVRSRATTCATSTGTSPPAWTTPYVREYIEDRELTAWLLLDRSRVDGLRSGRPAQGRRAHRAGGHRWPGCSRAGGNRVGAMLFDNTRRARRSRPRRGATRCCGSPTRCCEPGRPAPGTTDRPRPTCCAPRSRDRCGAGRSSSSCPTSSASRAGSGPLALLAQRHERGRHPRRRPARARAARRRDDRTSRTPRPASCSSSTPTTPSSAQRLRGRAGERQAALGRRPARPGVDLHPVATDDDLVARPGAHRRAAPPGASAAGCTFAWPLAARGARGRAARRASAYRRLRRAAAARAPPNWPHSASPAAARRSAGRAAASHLLLGAARPAPAARSPGPRSSVAAPRREGTVILAFDVSNSMARQRPQPTRMDAAKAAARAFVEQPAVDRADRRGRLRRRRAGHAAADRRTEASVLAAIDRLTPRGPRRSGSGHLSLAERDRRQAAERRRDRARQRLADAATSATTAPPRSSCCPTARTPPSRTRSRSPTSRRRPGVHIYPIGIGQPQGTVLQIDGFQLATALDEQR